MGRQISWFGFTTKKERRRQEEIARRKMFPFGEAQRQAELRLLRELIRVRAADTDLLFQLVQAKDCLHRREEEDAEDQNGWLREWLHSQLARTFPARELMCFLALAELEQDMQGLDQLPDADTVRRRAEQLCTERAALLW